MPLLAAPPGQPPGAPSPLSLCGAFGSLEQRALQKAREHNNNSDPAGAGREGGHGDTWKNNNNGEVDLDVDEELEKQVLLLLWLLLLLLLLSLLLLLLVVVVMVVVVSLLLLLSP